MILSRREQAKGKSSPRYQYNCVRRPVNSESTDFWPFIIDAYLFDDADENENDLKVQEFIKKHIGGIRTGRNALKRRELRLTLPKLSLETEVNLVNQMQVSTK